MASTTVAGGKYDRFILWLQLGKLHKQASCRAATGGVPLKRMVHSRHVIESTAKEAQCPTCWGLDAEPTTDSVGSNGRRGGGRNAPVTRATDEEVRTPYRPGSANTHLQEPRTWHQMLSEAGAAVASRFRTPEVPVKLPDPVPHVSPTKE